MLIFKNKYQPESTAYFEPEHIYLEGLSSLSPSKEMEKLLFFDIETTGLSSKTARIYLIGCVFYQNGWNYKQWFLDDVNEEKDLLLDFYEFAKDFDTLVHFNGNTFDIPFINDRFQKYAQHKNLNHFHSVDFYRLLKPLRNALSLPNAKQKTFETLLEGTRKDQMDGRLLIAVYKNWLEHHDETGLSLLLLHNLEDIKNLPRLYLLLSLKELFCEQSSRWIDSDSISAQCSDSKNYKQEFCRKLTISFCLTPDFPLHNLCFQSVKNGTHLTVRDRQLFLTVTSPDGWFHLYYSDYKNYYYLPEEDQAIHKSLASYVDKSHRQKASKDTCYSRFEATDAFLNKKEQVMSFITHSLAYLL